MSNDDELNQPFPEIRVERIGLEVHLVFVAKSDKQAELTGQAIDAQLAHGYLHLSMHLGPKGKPN